jgi:serine/threonine protein kinase
MNSGRRQADEGEGFELGSDLVLSVDLRSSSGGLHPGDEADTLLPPARAVMDESITVSTLRAGERSLLALVDGRRSVQDLVSLSGISEPLARRHLRSLFDQGIVIPKDPSAAAPSVAHVLAEVLSDGPTTPTAISTAISTAAVTAADAAPTEPTAVAFPRSGLKPNVTAFWVPPGNEAVPVASETGSSSSASAATTASAYASASVSESRAGSGSGPVAGLPGSGPASTAFRVGAYEVATRIAQGGMGSIYVCRRAAAGSGQRLFILKVVRQHSTQIEQALRSFRREARVGALIRHPNLQTVVDQGDYNGQPFLILDYIEGASLADVLANDKKPPVGVVIAVLLDVLRGLQRAHALVDEKGLPRGLVHGDISPQNILVGVDGAARLTDFGSTRFTAEGRSSEDDRDAGAIGKPAFMAPEQLRAEPIDARTDIFALGTVLWTAVTGQALFAADSYDQIVMKVLKRKIPPPSDFGAPAFLDEVVLRALSRYVDGRYPSAEEMAEALLSGANANGLLASPYEVGQWVRREFAEAVGERRRRIQQVFGGAGRRAAAPVAARVPTTEGGDSSPAGDPGAPQSPGGASADGFPRLPAPTVMLSNVRSAAPSLREPPVAPVVVKRGSWQVIALSALVAFPITLFVAYLISSLFSP